MNTTIFFDLDGTLNRFYSYAGWLDCLIARDVAPYLKAEVSLNMALLARYLHKAQKLGYRVGVISWLAKNSTEEYDRDVTQAKLDWLAKHLPSVDWDEINIVKYGTPKQNFMVTENDVLFDDEERNRNDWKGESYTPDMIIEILKQL